MAATDDEDRKAEFSCTRIDKHELMKLVKNYPCIYDKQDPGFRDKTAKGNAWKAISEQMSIDANTLFTRYCSIRTKLGKHHKELRGDYENKDLEIHSSFDYVSWLIPFIQHRAVNAQSENVKERENIAKAEELRLPSHSSESQSEDPADASGFGRTGCDRVANQCTAELRELSDLKLVKVPDDMEYSLTTSTPIESSTNQNNITIRSTSTAKPGRTNTNLRKRINAGSLRKTRLQSTAATMNTSWVNRTDGFRQRLSVNSDQQEYDEDYLFCMSLLPKFRRIPERHKSSLQISVLKAIVDFELTLHQQAKPRHYS